MKTIELAFKKLLGKGRAFSTPAGFMSEFLDLLVSPFSELKTRFINLKYTHFPTTNFDKNDIVNGETLFGIEDIEDKTLEERAYAVEASWLSVTNIETIEQYLNKRGFAVKVIENIPRAELDLYGARLIGNGFLTTNDGEADPITIKNNYHIIIIKDSDFYDEEKFLKLVKALVVKKQAHIGAYYTPYYLRKKEIHKVMTKSKMQSLKKKCYCDCRVTDEH